MEFDMQKVWMVWQTVDFGTDWLVGTFSTQAKADKAADDMFADWLADRDMTVLSGRQSRINHGLIWTTLSLLLIQLYSDLNVTPLW